MVGLGLGSGARGRSGRLKRIDVEGRKWLKDDEGIGVGGEVV